MYVVATISAVIFAAASAIQVVAAANPMMGIGPQALAWLDVLQKFLGGIAFLLPSLRKPPSDERVGMD